MGEKETNVVLARIETILAALPVAIKQAHERIIGERSVKDPVNGKITLPETPGFGIIIDDTKVEKRTQVTR